MSVDIRPLRPEDRPQWDRLWHAYLAFYDTELPAAQYDLHFARLVDPARPDIAGIVAAAPDGALLGLAHVIRHPHGWKPADVAYLQDLYVAPGARGTGLGRRLIEAVYAKADRDGDAGVYWLTQAFNTTARQLYDRVGQATPFVKYQRA